MKITTWTIQTPRTIPKLVTHNIARWKQTLSKNQVFLKIQLHVHFWSKCQKNTIVWVQCYFSNPTIWKPMAPAFQNTITFAQYLFNSRSNMRVNLAHWNSLHQKKKIFPILIRIPEISAQIPPTSFWMGSSWEVVVSGSITRKCRKRFSPFWTSVLRKLKKNSDSFFLH